MPLRESTAATRELGAELLRRREAAGLLAADLVRKTGWSATKVCRLEMGVGSYSEVAVATYLAHCGASAREAAEVMKLLEPDTGYSAGRNLLHRLILHENLATSICANSTTLVPGLLQTEDYIRAVMQAGGRLASEEVERRVALRRERQTLVRRIYPPQLQFIISEGALRLPIGGRRVMHDQLLHLVFLSDRPQVEIRVVQQAKSCLAVVTGQFVLMDFEAHSSVLCSDAGFAGVLIEEPEAIAQARATVRKILTHDALEVRESREVLVRIAGDYD